MIAKIRKTYLSSIESKYLKTVNFCALLNFKLYFHISFFAQPLSSYVHKLTNYTIGYISIPAAGTGNSPQDETNVHVKAVFPPGIKMFPRDFYCFIFDITFMPG